MAAESCIIYGPLIKALVVDTPRIVWLIKGHIMRWSLESTPTLSLPAIAIGPLLVPATDRSHRPAEGHALSFRARDTSV
jgi:hypothetical protein